MEIEVKGNKIELSKSFLTNGEVNYIITEVLKIYNQNDDDIEGLDYSPLAMMTNFYALLFSMCIKDYNLDDIGMYNEYYNMGVQYELLKVITNADEAYHLMMSLSKQMFSVENILDKNLNKLVNLISKKIPDKKTLNEMIDKLPDEWKNALGEYNQIMRVKDTKEDE